MMKILVRLCYLSLSVLFVMIAPVALGVDRTWTGLAGDTLWATPGNWSGNTAPTGNADQAIFPAGTPTACMVDASTSIKCIYFRNPGMKLTIASGKNLHFDNTGTVTILAEQDAVIDGDGTITFSTAGGENFADNQASSGKTLTILAKITGVNGFEHNGGGGTIVLANAANDQVGPTLITATGVLSVPSVANSGVASPLGSNSAVRITSTPCTLRYTGTGHSTDRAFYQNAGGGQDVTIEHAGSGTLTFAGSFLSGVNNAHAFIFNVVAGAVIENSGIISNGVTAALGLYKQGAGTQLLSAVNTYTGNTTVDAGTLGITPSGAISASSVIQMRGGTLLLNAGTAAATYTATFGALQINGNSSTLSVAPAATSATITFASLTQNAGSIDFAASGLGTTTKIFITGQPDGLIGPWATVNNGAALAAYSSANGIYAATLPTQPLLALGPSTIMNNVNEAARITADGTSGGISLGSNPTEVALLSQETASNAVVSLGGQALILPRAQVTSGSGSLTLGSALSDGTLYAPTSAAGKLFLANDNAAGGSAIMVNAAIINNGATAVRVEKLGAGDVVLAGPLSHTGGTAVNAGVLTLDTPASTVRAFPAGGISGNGGLTLTGSGTLAFPNVANTYAGTTTVAQGTARILHSATFGAAAAPTVVKSGAAIDFWGTANDSLNLGTEMIYAEGSGPDGSGALVNTGTWSQYNAMNYLTLTGPTTVGGSQRLDIRGGNAASTFLNLNGHGITKKGGVMFGLTQTTVTNDQNTSFIDITQGSVTLEDYATLSGGPSNYIHVRGGGAYFDLYNIRSPITWAFNLDSGARINNRNGNATNLNILAGPVTLNGDVTLTSDGAFIDSFTGVISGTGQLVKNGNDASITYLRNTNNAWVGGAKVIAGTLYASDPATLPGYDTAVTVTNTGCLALRVADTAATQSGFSLAQINALINNGTTFQAVTAAVGFDTAYESLDYTAALPQIGVRKFGSNTLTLSGTGPNLGPVRIYGGTLDLSPVSRYLADQNISVGYSTSTADALATLVVTNAAQITTLDKGYNIGGQPQVLVGDAGRGVMRVSDSAKVAARIVVGNAGTAAGAVYQTGGTVHNTGGSSNDGRIGAGGYGYYLLAGGSLTNNGWSQIGLTPAGLGVLEQTGGQFSFSTIYGGNYGLSRGGTGIAHLSGGKFYSSVTLWVGDPNENNATDGYGSFTVADTAEATINGAIDMGNRINMTAMVNLKGGVLNANRIYRASRTGTEVLVNWNGGLFRANSVAQTELFNGAVAGLYPDVTLYAGGARVELPTNTMTLAVNTPLRAPALLGLVSIPVATPGAGYLGAPIVKITGGGGKGASAFAHINLASGTLSSIEVVSPGTGYTNAPTIALLGGGATTAATLGTPVLSLSTSGGLTKLGAGVLLLNATNTYTGTTEVREGTLRLGGTHALNPRSPVSVTGGRLDLAGISLTNEDISVTSGTIANGVIATGILEKNGAGTFDLQVPVTLSTAHAQPALIPGLWEGRLAGAFDTTTPNPQTSIQLTTRAVNGWCNSGGTINGAQWPDNATYAYSGYIWNRAPTNETWTFAENFDDSVLLRIDGTNVLNNGNWSEPTKANVTLTPGPHLFEARFGQGGGGAAGNISGWWNVNTQSFAVDFQGRNEANLANYTLLTDSGDGSRLTLNQPEAVEVGPERAIVNVNEGTLRSMNALPGLWEGRIDVRWDTTSANPSTAVELTTTAANGACGSGGTINAKLWPDNSMYVYSGYIWNRAPTNATWTFAENFDDQVLLRIDGVTVLNDATWNLPTKGTITLSPGAHAFDLRLGQGGGGAGGSNNGGWNTTRSFGVDFLGRNVVDFNNFVLLTDPGNGSLLSRTAIDPLGSEGMLANVVVNLAAGAALNLNNESQKVGEVTGSGVVSNGTLAAGTILSPAGDIAVGSLNVQGVTFSAGTSYRLTIIGTGSDRLISSGALDLSGLTIVPATNTVLMTASTYVIAQAAGGFTGTKPAISGFPSKYVISKQGTDLLLTSQYGTLILLR
jgi:autotransporter-associated beta strand protein